MIVYSLNRVLEFDTDDETDEEVKVDFVVYCQAIRCFLELHLRNQAVIYALLHEWGGFEMEKFLAESDDVQARAPGLLLRIAEQIETVSHKELFQPLADLFLPELARAEAFFRDKKLTDIPKSVEKKLTKAVEKNNRGDPNARYSVPLLFWTLSPESYDLMIRKSVPYPFRVLLSYMFWEKGKHIKRFVPHYRTNWQI